MLYKYKAHYQHCSAETNAQQKEYGYLVKRVFKYKKRAAPDNRRRKEHYFREYIQFFLGKFHITLP